MCLVWGRGEEGQSAGQGQGGGEKQEKYNVTQQSHIHMHIQQDLVRAEFIKYKMISVENQVDLEATKTSIKEGMGQVCICWREKVCACV